MCRLGANTAQGDLGLQLQAFRHLPFGQASAFWSMAPWLLCSLISKAWYGQLISPGTSV